MRARVFAVGLSLVAAACSPDIPSDPPPGARVVALFDPGAATPVVPTPNDLARDEARGLLAVPDAPDAGENQRAFNRYLRTLSGFPPSSTAAQTFSAPLDPATVGASSVRLFDVTAGGALAVDAGTLKWEPGRMRISLTGPFEKGHRYAVVLDGSALKGASGEEVVGAPATLLIRSRTSLVDCVDLASPDCHATASLISGADEADRAKKAVTLERVRRAVAPAIDAVEASGTPRDRIVAAWTFTISADPFVLFDPLKELAPFPNDLLLVNGKVKIADAPDDDLTQAKLKSAIRELDGFSTTGAIRTEPSEDAGFIDEPVDPASVLPAQFLLVALDAPSSDVPFTLTCRDCADGGTAAPGLWLRPREPLRSHTRYAVLWLKGARAQGGKLANVPPLVALARMPNPLLFGGRSSIDSVDDETAAVVEELREAAQPALGVADLRGIPREDVLLAWHFTTQTTVDALPALARKPAEWNLSTAVSDVTDAGLSRFAALYTSPFLNLTYDVSSKVRDFKEGRFQGGVALELDDFEFDLDGGAPLPMEGDFSDALLAQPRIESLGFSLVLPKRAALPDGGIPVVIFGHGLGGARGQLILIANQIADAGYATLSIDAPLHGDRTYCRNDSPCSAGTQCVAHRCEGGVGYAAISLDPTQSISVAGAPFISATHLAATRDHFRQHVIDIAQLLRVLRDADAGLGSIDVDDPNTPEREHLVPTSPRYIGQSLGGLMGTLDLVGIPELAGGTINVAGAGLPGILQGSQSFRENLDALHAYLATKGISPGTQAYDEFIDIAGWILDPADPINVARHLTREPLDGGTAKRVFVSWIEGDATIPNAATVTLLQHARPRTPTPLFSEQQYDGGAHEFLLLGPPALTVRAQADAVGFTVAP